MFRLLLAICLTGFWLADSCRAADRRVALIVGASNYAHATKLAHPADDARDMAAALRRLGFEVDLVLDPDRSALEGAVRRWGQKSRGADASLFYYSGHALEAQGVNWILPVSANVSSDRDLRCLCGRLVARLVPGGVEIKCGRCKRTMVIPLSPRGER